MMLAKKLFRILVLTVIATASVQISIAQKVDTSHVIQWKAAARPSKSPADLTISLTATIQPGWHLYALDQEQGGPMPTVIRLADAQPFALAGAVQQPEPVLATDPNFDMPVRFFEHSATFTVPVARKGTAKPKPTSITLDVSYQTCNDRFCLPLTTAKVEARLPSAAH